MIATFLPDERLVPGDMGLAHGRREPVLERRVQLTKPTVAIALRMNRVVFLPENRQADTGSLHLAYQRRPVRFGIVPCPQLAARRGKQQLLQRLVSQIGSQRPAKTRRIGAGQVVLHRGAANADLPGNHPGARVNPEMEL